MNKRFSLAEVTQRLAAVAKGFEPAETVIRGGKLVNVNTGEIIPNVDIAVTHGRIALVGDASHTIGERTQVINAQGFHLAEGAVASTVAHDSHNLLIVGTNDEDMALAGNTLAEVGGGMVAVRNGKIISLLPLPIGGLMCEEPAEAVAQRVGNLDKAWKELGCNLVSPFMTMALIALAVLPELRLTNRGLIDTVNFKPVDLFID